MNIQSIARLIVGGSDMERSAEANATESAKLMAVIRRMKALTEPDEALSAICRTHKSVEASRDE